MTDTDRVFYLRLGSAVADGLCALADSLGVPATTLAAELLAADLGMPGISERAASLRVLELYRPEDPAGETERSTT